MIRAVLSIGSNMGDKQQLLDMVVEEFAAELVAVSQYYTTPAWGGVEQDDFLNAALIVEVEATPLELLHRCQALENRAHRTREVRWGPRTLDVDIVSIHDDGELSSDDPVLTLPHPWAHARAFVLVPWQEIDPHATLHGTAISQWLAQCPKEDRDNVRPLNPGTTS